MGELNFLKKGPKSAERAIPTGVAAEQVAATRAGVSGVDIGHGRFMNGLRAGVAAAALFLASAPNSGCEYPQDGGGAPESVDSTLKSEFEFLRSYGISIAPDKIVLPRASEKFPEIRVRINGTTSGGTPIDPSEYPLGQGVVLTVIPIALEPKSEVTVTYVLGDQQSEPFTATVPAGLTPERPTPIGRGRTTPGDEPGGTESPSEGDAA